MIDLIKELPDIQGCYLLTPTGTLGRYGPDRRIQPDNELSQSLAAPIDRFLQEYRDTHDARWMRLGVVHADRSDKPWKTATLAFADDVLRRLYPTTAARDGRMTSFQENIGARRLYTVLERLLEEVSFDAGSGQRREVRVDAAYVDERLADLSRNEDLARYVL